MDVAALMLQEAAIVSRLEEPVAAVLPLPVWEEIATVAEWHHRAAATWDPAIILALPHAAVAHHHAARTVEAVPAAVARTAAAAAHAAVARTAAVAAHAAAVRTAAAAVAAVAVHAVAVRTAAAAAIPVAAVAMAVRQAVADDVANEHLS
jgi:hypothetical protein